MFYSTWAAIVPGLVGLGITLAILATAHFIDEGIHTPDTQLAENHRMSEELDQNEAIARQAFTLYETMTPEEFRRFLVEQAIPAWKKNLQRLE